MTVYSLNICVFVYGRRFQFQVLLSISKNGTKRSTYLNDISFHNCILVERWRVGVGGSGERKRKREGAREKIKRENG